MLEVSEDLYFTMPQFGFTIIPAIVEYNNRAVKTAEHPPISAVELLTSSSNLKFFKEYGRNEDTLYYRKETLRWVVEFYKNSSPSRLLRSQTAGDRRDLRLNPIWLCNSFA